MGYERKTEKYSMNLNVSFQVVPFDFLPWHLNHLREGAYRRLNLKFYCLTFQRTVVKFEYKSLGKREAGVYNFFDTIVLRTL